MADMSPKKTEMRTQPPKERSKNFGEVALGYTKEEVVYKKGETLVKGNSVFKVERKRKECK